MKLIDKDALVAEIERRNEESWLGHYTKEKGIVFDITEDILSFIDTLEVKEVDFNAEEELKKYGISDLKQRDILIAHHFYTLGLKAQKGE